MAINRNNLHETCAPRAVAGTSRKLALGVLNRCAAHSGEYHTTEICGWQGLFSPAITYLPNLIDCLHLI
jgi:hypothetical protein